MQTIKAPTEFLYLFISCFQSKLCSLQSCDLFLYLSLYKKIKKIYFVVDGKVTS